MSFIKVTNTASKQGQLMELAFFFFCLYWYDFCVSLDIYLTIIESFHCYIMKEYLSVFLTLSFFLPFAVEKFISIGCSFFAWTRSLITYRTQAFKYSALGLPCWIWYVELIIRFSFGSAFFLRPKMILNDEKWEKLEWSEKHFWKFESRLISGN